MMQFEVSQPIFITDDDREEELFISLIADVYNLSSKTLFCTKIMIIYMNNMEVKDPSFLKYIESNCLNDLVIIQYYLLCS